MIFSRYIFCIVVAFCLSVCLLNGQSGEIPSPQHNDDSESCFLEPVIEEEDLVSTRLEEEYVFRMSLLEERLKAARIRTWALSFLLVLYFTIAYFVYRTWKLKSEKKLAEERAEVERLMNVAEDLQLKLKERQAVSSKNRYDMLQRLCEQYYIYEGTENLQPKILKEVKSMIEELRGDARSLEDSLNSTHDGVMNKFRSSFPKMKEEDIRLFCFMASGFSSTTISAILSKEKQYVYNRIYRLKNRINESNSPDKDLFIACLQR